MPEQKNSGRRGKKIAAVLRRLAVPTLGAIIGVGAAEAAIHAMGAVQVNTALKEYYESAQKRIAEKQRELNNALNNGRISKSHFQRAMIQLNTMETRKEENFIRQNFGRFLEVRRQRPKYWLLGALAGAGAAEGTRSIIRLVRRQKKPQKPRRPR